MNISLDDNRLIYSGRIDLTKDKKPEFIFPASCVSFVFWGKWAKIRLMNRRICWNNYVGAIVDDAQKVWKLNDDGITDIVLCESDRSIRHNILFFKRMDACHQFQIISIELDDGAILLNNECQSKRKIEVYGDSVSAGEVSEAVDYIGLPDPSHNGEYSNSWYSYAWMTARKLNAQLHNVSQGGIPLLNDTGWVSPYYPGMEFMWDKLRYRKELDEPSMWDFTKYIPHVVIVAIGQNDSHPVDYMKLDYECEKAKIWRENYRAFLLKLRSKYPKTMIVCCTTLLEHDNAWDRAIGEVCYSLYDKNVKHYLFQRNGRGTKGHLRIAEADEMACELAEFINGLEIEGWDE